MTQDRTKTTPGSDAPDLTPDLTPEPGDTLTREDFDTALADATAQIRAEFASQLAVAAVPVAVRPTNGAPKQVPVNRHRPPSEPTYEPPFIPTSEDYAAANSAMERGELVDEPIPVGGTIIAIDLEGTEHIVTPKAFRTLYAARGWVAHAEDAVRGLAGRGGNKRRRRGGGNIVGSRPDNEQAQAPSRRRRRGDDD